ncbi:MAG TPA: hypothetical protein ENG48_09585 [Candidatus Atribacteria bacterium]|nr:hypothetical protein [Candidatus Atribacteria bacterium]
MKKRLFFIIVIVMIIVFFLMSGHRLTPDGAAKAHAFLEKNAKIVKEIEIGWGRAYIYKINYYYRTVLVVKNGFLWRSPVSMTTENSADKKDNIRTIGWMNYSNNREAITILAVKSYDDEIAYIEAGTDIDREKKEIRKDETVVFLWEKPFYIDNINPIALSRNNKLCYRYGYPEDTNIFRAEELKWHKVK